MQYFINPNIDGDEDDFGDEDADDEEEVGVIFSECFGFGHVYCKFQVDDPENSDEN